MEEMARGSAEFGAALGARARAVVATFGISVQSVVIGAYERPVAAERHLYRRVQKGNSTRGWIQKLEARVGSVYSNSVRTYNTAVSGMACSAANQGSSSGTGFAARHAITGLDMWRNAGLLRASTGFLHVPFADSIYSHRQPLSRAAWSRRYFRPRQLHRIALAKTLHAHARLYLGWGRVKPKQHP